MNTPYTEGNLVQQTTADYLKRRLSRKSVYANNNEDFGSPLMNGDMAA